MPVKKSVFCGHSCVSFSNPAPYCLPADYLAQAFYSLHKDLKSDEGKALFLEYQALPVVLNHLRTSSKGLLSAALDILLQMSVETSK